MRTESERTIYKYEFREGEKTYGEPYQMMVQKGAIFLSMQVQRGIPCLWFLVDPKAHQEQRSFEIYGTGWDMPEKPGEYRGTYQLANGTLVFHVFETTGL